MLEQIEGLFSATSTWSHVRRPLITYFGNIEIRELVSVARALDGTNAMTLCRVG